MNSFKEKNMRSIILRIETNRGLVLPFAHSHTLQGLVYELLSFDPVLSSGLHNKRDKRTDAMKLFCFSDLRGRYRKNTAERTLVYNGALSFEVRSPNDIIIETIAKSVRDDPLIVINGCECAITGFRIDSPEFPCNILDMRMNTPVTVYRSGADKKRIYYTPEEAEFYEIIRSNLLKKYLLVFGAPYEGELAFTCLDAASCRRVVTRYKGDIINAFLGSYRLEASPQMLAIAYYCGIGSKNSMGFGFVDPPPIQ